MSAIKIIENYYAAFNKKDNEGMLQLLTDDVIHDINQGKREIGKSKFRDFLNGMHQYYDETVTGLVILKSADETRMASEFYIEGVYKKAAPGLPPAHNQKYKLLIGCFFEIRDNKISRVTNYYNVQDWLIQVE